MREIDHTANGTEYHKLTPDQQAETNKFILREALYYFDLDFDKLRKALNEMEESDAERAYDRFVDDGENYGKSEPISKPLNW